MPFVVETGAGLPNSNSYVSVAEADAYFASNGNPVEWTNTPATATMELYNQPGDGQDFRAGGGAVYLFVNALTATTGYIKIGGTLEETVRNLVGCVNNVGQNGVWFRSAGPDVAVSAKAEGTNVTFTLKTGGTAGNALSCISSLTLPNRFTTALMTGGKDAKQDALMIATAALDRMYKGRWMERRTRDLQSLDWPRAYVDDSDWFRVASDVIPTRIKEATCELALAYLKGDVLIPDQSAAERSIRSQSIKVGPIEKSTAFGASGKSYQKRYTAVENLVRQYVTPGTRIHRA